MTKAMLSLFCMVVLCSALNAQDIIGFWKSINAKTGKTKCIVAIYEYQNKYYGRIIATCDSTGKVDDTIYAPTDRAPGLVGTPYYCGLDLIWNLHNKGSKYNGKIVDPQKGNVYNAEVWVEDGNLVVRGKLLFFGRSEIWKPVTATDFPSGFTQPDVTQFVPAIPEVD